MAQGRRPLRKGRNRRFRLRRMPLTITTRLVDTVTTPMLLKTVQSHKIAATKLITHRFKFGNILEAYETFGAAANTQPSRS